MGKMNLGRVKGTMIYSGSKITGTSSAGKIFPTSGIAKACIGDMYINTDSSSEDNKGNVYECNTAGDAATAMWYYKGNIRGPKVQVINNLQSTSTTEALGAYQGKVLWDTLVNAGVLARSVLVSTNAPVGSVSLKIDNINTVITLIVDGSRYTYPYVATGTSKETTINIGLASVGVPSGRGNVTKIESTNANIYYFKIKDPGAGGIYEREVNLWDAIIEATENHEIRGSILIGGENVFIANIYKYVDKIKKLIYPITHAKSVWFDKNRTVHDEISDLKENFICKKFVEEEIALGAYGTKRLDITISHEGYFPMAIRSWKTRNSDYDGINVVKCNLYEATLDGDYCTLKICNREGEAAKIAVEIEILYSKLSAKEIT